MGSWVYATPPARSTATVRSVVAIGLEDEEAETDSRLLSAHGNMVAQAEVADTPIRPRRRAKREEM